MTVPTGQARPGPWVLLASLVAAGGLGCAHDSAPPAPGPSSKPAAAARGGSAAGRYFPLAVGNHWTYEATYLGERSTREVELVGFRDGSYVDRDGRALRVDGEGLRDQTRYLLHEPLVEGGTWTSVVAPGSAEHYRVLSAGVPCKVPAGSFPDCIEVESRNRADPTRTLVNTITFAAGVGIVRVRTELDEGGRLQPTAELRLTAYRVAPAPPR
jgi:hypothetical protein